MKSTNKRYAAAGLRLGIQFTIPDLAAEGGTRLVRNGEIEDADSTKYLRSVGYTLVECDGVPQFDPQVAAAAERAADLVAS